jgi:hypothetical protein
LLLRRPKWENVAALFVKLQDLLLDKIKNLASGTLQMTSEPRALKLLKKDQTFVGSVCTHPRESPFSPGNKVKKIP